MSDIIQSETGYHIFKINNISIDKKSESIDVSHILIKSTNNGAQRIQIIKNLLNSGMEFKYLANTYSEDKNNFKNGDVRPFRFSKFYLTISEEAYDTDPGEISDILETKFGFFIIKTESINKPDNSTVKKLKKNAQLIPKIKSIKSRFKKDIKRTKLMKKILNKYKVKSYPSLLTNRNQKPEDILMEVPEISLRKSRKECVSLINQSAAPNISADIKAKMNNIYEKTIFDETAYKYALAKDLHKDETLVLKIIMRN